MIRRKFHINLSVVDYTEYIQILGYFHEEVNNLGNLDNLREVSIDSGFNFVIKK